MENGTPPKEIILDEMISQLKSWVKADPTNGAIRFELGQTMLIANDLTAADTHFDLAMTQDPEWMPKVTMMRQLIRGLASREETFTQAAAPEVLSAPSPFLAKLLEANVAFQDNDPAAADLFAEAEELRPAVKGTVGGKAFSDLRDLDDRTAGILEVLSSNGKYFWIEMSRVKSIEFQPAPGLRAQIIPQAEITVADGPTGVVFLPTVYWGQGGEQSEAQRLGRESDWSEGQAPVCGVGRRCLLADDELVVFGDTLGDIIFEQSES